MNFEFFASSPLVQSLGWTLLHSLWQTAAIAAGLFVLLKIAKNATANFRYLLACAALVLAFAVPIATFVFISDSAEKTGAQQSLLKLKGQNAPSPENARDESVLAGSLEKSQVAQKTNRTNFVSFENLQNRFEKLATESLPVLVWLWLAGVALFALKTGGGLWQLRRLKNEQSTGSVSDEWQARFADLCEKVCASSQIKLRESALVNAPIVVGWLKPVILIPCGAFLQLAPAQIEAVIAHELMHIRRHDFLVNLAQTAIENLLFYHPCAWWISATIRREREFVCDDLVVKFYGERLTYARALADLEQFRQTATRTTPPELSLAANGGKLMKRIQRILQKETEIKRATSLWSAALACLLISAFLLTVFSVEKGNSVNAESAARSKKMAIGFVSIPPTDRSDNPPHDAQATAQILIEKLKAHRVPAIGFLIGASVSDGEKLFPVRAEIVRTWRDAGFEVGIGGFRHISFYHTPYDDYVANVEKNEQIAKRILAEKNLPLRYFSYPYLKTGKSTEEKARFENWLAARGLRSVKYTFDNQEWMYSFAYDAARKDNDINTMKQIRAEFLDYMTKMLAHYEAYSQEMFGRDVAQTMVLTPSRLVADTADELFGHLEKRGYAFVSLDEAQADEAYKTAENFVGDSGISWFERWQMARGAKLRDEPPVSKTVEKIWNDAKAKK